VIRIIARPVQVCLQSANCSKHSRHVATLKVSDRVTDLGAFVREQRESARLSLRQLAKAAGVSNPYLSQIERGLRRPSAEVLTQIAKGLQISAEALFQRAGLLDESGSVEVEVAVHGDTRLTARQKRVLLDIYATFRAENARQDAGAEVDAEVDAATAAATVVPLIAKGGPAELKSRQAGSDQAGAGDDAVRNHPAGSGRRGGSRRGAARKRADGGARGAARPGAGRSTLRRVGQPGQTDTDGRGAEGGVGESRTPNGQD